MGLGFDPSNKEPELSALHYALAGGISGAVTRAVVQPLDVFKIRFQLQQQPVLKQSSGKYWGILQATRTIVKEEGYGALWKGHVPAQLLSISWGAVQFVSFEVCTRAVHRRFNREGLDRDWPGKWEPMIHFVCGGVAGCVSTLVCMPFDVVRTRLVAQGEPKVYSNLRDAVRQMYLKEGLASFYKGLVPASVQLFPYSGFQFGFYRLFHLMWTRAVPSHSNGSGSHWQNLVCGGLAGLVSKTLVFPLDLVKKRIQVQGFEQARAWFGDDGGGAGQRGRILGCVRQIFRREGMAGFYKGLSPSLLKAVSSSGLIFCIYEACCQVLKYHQRPLV